MLASQARRPGLNKITPVCVGGGGLCREGTNDVINIACCSSTDLAYRKSDPSMSKICRV